MSAEGPTIARAAMPAWPAWLRWGAPLALGTLVFVTLLVAGALSGVDAIAMAGFGFGPAVALLASAALGVRRTRRLPVAIGPGLVRIGTGPLGETIVPADVTGASTARRSDGVSLAIALRRSPLLPLELRVQGEGEARAIATALGVGHGGTGFLTWQLVPRWAVILDRVLRLIGALAWLGVGVGLLLSVHSPDAAAAIVGLASIVAINAPLLLLAILLGTSVAASAVQLGATGLAVREGRLDRRIPWKDIVSVERRPEGIRIVTRRGVELLRSPAAAGDETVRHLAAQIESAVSRARGLGPDAPDHSAVADLARGAREPIRAWLARIDGIAGQGFGYRGRPMGVGDLWALLEDPDAPPDARAAAARLLARIAPEDLRVRIAPVLSTVPSDGPRRRIYVASHVGETERAALELEAVEREEAEAARRPSLRA